MRFCPQLTLFCSAGGARVKGGEDAPGNPGGHQPVPPSSPSPSPSTSCLPPPSHGTPFLSPAPSLPTPPYGRNAPSPSPASSASPCAAQSPRFPRYRRAVSPPAARIKNAVNDFIQPLHRETWWWSDVNVAANSVFSPQII